MLLACNHPNSFLDAIIIGSQFNQPVHYLARGDAFKNPLVKKILTAIKLMPIYRLSEGREYLALNDATFDSCKNVLLQSGIVLIFSEGLCEHKWQLQPLKKGTARIAFSAWNEPAITKDFKVQPVSINYNSFTKFGKHVFIHFGEVITKDEVLLQANEGEKMQQFNVMLTERLTDGMLLSNNNDAIVQILITNHKSLVSSGETTIKVLKALQIKLQYSASIPLSILSTNFIDISLIILLLVPATIGFAVNAPFYFLVKKIAQQQTKNTVFYDSVLFGLLLITYPIYWLTINCFSLIYATNYYLQIGLLVMPLFAWLCLACKDALWRIKLK